MCISADVCVVSAGRAPQFDVNAKFDVQDDDFSPDGEVDEITFVKQALQARRQHRDQNPDPRLR